MNIYLLNYVADFHIFANVSETIFPNYIIMNSRLNVFHAYAHISKKVQNTTRYKIHIIFKPSCYKLSIFKTNASSRTKCDRLTAQHLKTTLTIREKP